MSKWISVDEEMPRDGQDVLFVVSCKDSPVVGYLHRRVMAGRFSITAGRPIFSSPGFGLNASHWMPLPEPPQ